MNSREKTQSCADNGDDMAGIKSVNNLEIDRTDKDDTRILDRLHCPTCLRTFHDGSRTHYEKHLNTCGKGSFPCSVCNNRFCSASIRKKHHDSIHLKLKSYRCGLCSQEFTTQFNLKNHLERAHGTHDAEVHSCFHCSKEFKWKSSLSRHILERHCYEEIEAFQCFCGLKFSKYHQAYVHKKSCDVHKKKKATAAINVETHVEIEDRGYNSVTCRSLDLENAQENREIPRKSSGIVVNECVTNVDDIDAVGHHKCQFCKQVFMKKQMLEDHVDSCDPYDQAVDWLHLNLDRSGKRVNQTQSKETECYRIFALNKRGHEVHVAEEEARKNLKKIEKVKENTDEAVVEISIHVDKMSGLENCKASNEEKNLLPINSLTQKNITSVYSSEENATNSNAREKQRIEIDNKRSGDLTDIDDLDSVVKEVCSNEVVYGSRPRRKRKLKLFEDYESDYLDLLSTRKRKCLNSLDNDSDIHMSRKSVDKKPISQKADGVTGKRVETADGITRSSVTYLCPLCDKTDEVLEDVQTHIKSSHDQKRLSWVVLSSKYKGMEGIDKDPASSVKPGKTKCSNCQTDCQSTEELKSHMNKHHAYFPYCCGICCLAYSTLEAAKLHMRKIHVQGHACVHCPKRFHNDRNLTQHYNRYHKGQTELAQSDTGLSGIDKGDHEHSGGGEKDDTVDVLFKGKDNEGSDSGSPEQNKGTPKVVSVSVICKKKLNEIKMSENIDKYGKSNNETEEFLSKRSLAENKKDSGKIAKTENIEKNFSGRQNTIKNTEHSIIPKQRLQSSDTVKNEAVNDSNEFKARVTKPKNIGSEDSEEQNKKQKIINNKNRKSAGKKDEKAERNQGKKQARAVIETIKIVPRNVFRKITRAAAAEKEKEAETAIKQEVTEVNENHGKLDTGNTEIECIDFDAQLSDTDEDIDEDTVNVETVGPKQKNTKKIAIKQQLTQRIFDFTKLKDVYFKCLFETCEEVLPSFDAFLGHLMTHTKKKKRPPFKCLECSYSTQDKKILSQHLLIKHNSLETVEIALKYCEVLHSKTLVPLKIIACVFCGFLNDLEHFQSQHKCYRKRLHFYCPFCSTKDSDFDSLQEHIKGEHSEKTIHRQEMGDKYQSLRKSPLDPASKIGDLDRLCEKCELQFETNVELKLHVNEKHAIFPYSCGVCRQCYGRHTAVMDHIKKTHSLPMACQFCDRRFGDNSDLSRHEASHQKTKPFKCDLCESRYADQKALRIHHRQKHSEKARDELYKQRVDNDSEPELLICDVCGLSFGTRIEYKKHSQRHSDELENQPKINCDICSKSFTKKAFTRHLCTKALEGNDPFIIDGYRDTVESIQDIFKKIRKNPTPGSSAKVCCGLCSKEFNKNKYMYNHIRQVHLPNEGKKIHCTVCGLGFNRKAQLISHMRSHSNVKPYTCRICSKSYRQLGHVRVHLLSHSKKPSFKCRLCSQAFKAKCSLANHVLTHCDVFPYKCFVIPCKKAFNSLQNLLVHMRQCVSNSKLASSFECKLCSHKIDSLKNGLSHMKSHGKEPLYKCNKCLQNFMSYKKLYYHKDMANHFLQIELENAEAKSTCAQNFKCVEVDEDIVKLQRMYDYKAEDLYLENCSMNALNHSVDGDNVDFQDVEEVEVENVFETDELMDIAEQLTHMAAGEERKNQLSQAEANMSAYDDSVVIGTSVPCVDSESNSTTINESLNNNFTPVDDNIYLAEKVANTNDEDTTSYRDTHTESINKSDFNLGQLENNYMPTERRNVFDKEEGGMQMKILGSHPIIDENAVIVATESPVGKQPENNLGKETEVEQNEDQSTVEIHFEDQQETNVITEKMLASSKIFDEFGKEVKVNVVNEKGHHVPIQSNPELLQTLLSTGKYTLQFTNTDFNTEEYSKDIEESTAAEADLLAKDNTAIDFDHLDFTIPGSSDIYVINEVPPVEEYRYSVETDNTFERNEKKKKVKQLVSPKKRKLMNIDKVFGEIVDKEAQVGNTKMEEGQINYKVRLHYYEDRTKEEELFPLKCDVCACRFRRVKDLNLHKKRHLPDEARPFQCKECGKGYTTRHTFQAHMRTHTGERPHQCDQCAKSFRQLGHLQTHLRSHANYRPFKCRHCDKTFVTNSQLKKHIQVHGGHFKQTFENGVNCLVCGNVFANETDLCIHRLKHLGAAAQNELLEGFNILTADKSQDRKATKVKAAPQEKCICDVCGKLFNRPSDLKDHKDIHITGPKIPCKICRKEFVSERRLQTHINNVHSVERWQCETCGLQLKTKLSFKCHLRSHREPQFQCSQCKKTFSRKHAFLQHLSSCLGDSFMQKVQNLTENVLNARETF